MRVIDPPGESENPTGEGLTAQRWGFDNRGEGMRPLR